MTARNAVRTLDHPPAPMSVVDSSGRPAVGAYAGIIPRVRWEGLRSPHARNPIWRRLRGKRWHYVSIAGPRCFVALCIVDVGWATNGFAYVYDRTARKCVSDFSVIAPPALPVHVSNRPGEGARSVFRWFRTGLKLERPKGSTLWHAKGRGPCGFRLDAVLDASSAPPALAAVAPISGGIANCTHKTVCLPVRGVVEAAGKRFDLDGYTGAFDHTSGLLGRRTEWRWAFMSSPGVAFNLVQGFNGPVENAIWIDGRLYSGGPVKIDFVSEERGWTVRSVDNRVDLSFRPGAWRRENVNFGLAKTRFLQAVGEFSGTLRPGPVRQIQNLVGVAENHFAEW